MYERIGVRFQLCAAVVFALRRAALTAFSVLKIVLASCVANVSLRVFEKRHAVFAARVLGTINGAAARQSRQIGQSQSEQLIMKNMVDAPLQIGNFIRQSDQQPLGDFAQEHAAFATRVKKRRFRIREQFLLQQIQHGVRDFRRRENLVTGQVGDAGQNVAGTLGGIV